MLQIERHFVKKWAHPQFWAIIGFFLEENYILRSKLVKVSYNFLQECPITTQTWGLLNFWKCATTVRCLSTRENNMDRRKTYWSCRSFSSISPTTFLDSLAFSSLERKGKYCHYSSEGIWDMQRGDISQKRSGVIRCLRKVSTFT